MKSYYHGDTKRPYFEGWYLKHQTKDGPSLALIPALHIDSSGQLTASLQVISNHGSWWLDYPETAFHASETPFRLQLGENTFSHRGVSLNITRPDLSLRGNLRYGAFTSLKSHIMGPFRFFPHMECAHGVVSMGHSLTGQVNLNGELLDFSGGQGYIETDRGRSFPKAYLWTQCAWQDPQPTSLMLSIATIPLGPLGFTGCICAILHGGKEYRLATYRGVRVEKWSETGAVIRQGKHRLEVELLSGTGHPLKAPVQGAMGRTIHEILCSTIRYRFWAGETLLFDHTDPRASFEYSDQAPKMGG